jgi:hypothetical protein
MDIDIVTPVTSITEPSLLRGMEDFLYEVLHECVIDSQGVTGKIDPLPPKGVCTIENVTY